MVFNYKILRVILGAALLMLWSGFALAEGDSPRSPRARDLATYEWTEGDYLGRVTVIGFADGRGYDLLLCTGMRRSEDGGLSRAAEDGGIYKILVREGKPIVRSDMHALPLLELEPHPWKTARTIIALRRRLSEIAEEWALGDEDAQTAADVLRQIADYDWEHGIIRVEIITKLLTNPQLSHVYLDISWDEVAKYAVASPEATERTAEVINRFPDRVLFGTDEVAPTEQAKYLKIYDIYAPLFARLTPEAKEKLLKGNYKRIFDKARRDVRAWEKANVK